MATALTTLDTGEVRARIRSYIRENFLYLRPDLQLADDDRLLQRRILDSMGAVELVQFLEATFDFDVHDDEITEQNLGSIALIADFVLRKRTTPSTG
jgi:acyl carrier protein